MNERRPLRDGLARRLRVLLSCPPLAIALLQCSPAPPHGRMSELSLASRPDWKACRHRVPEEVCVRCHPERAAAFQRRGDWCREHAVPESQCLECHPDLDFSPPLEPPAGSDVAHITREGRDVARLEAHLVSGKVTVFDFGASWCPPCRTVDRFLYSRITREPALAIRKLDVGSWDSPLATRWLGDVAELPYLVVYDRHGKKTAEVVGARLEALDRAVTEALR